MLDSLAPHVATVGCVDLDLAEALRLLRASQGMVRAKETVAEYAAQAREGGVVIVGPADGGDAVTSLSWG